MPAPLIYCPRCAWRPSAASRWLCSRTLAGCGESWNTFDTRGVCPSCGCRWEITQCLSCQQFSLHEHWYHDPHSSRQEAAERERESVEG